MYHWQMRCWLLCMSMLKFSATGRAEGKLQRVYHGKECLDPQALGMENKRIPDTSIWASSSEPTRIPQLARVGDNAGAWTASTANVNQYLGVDLGERMMVTAIETQGRNDSQEFVTEYYLQYSDDKNTWRYYTNGFGMPNIFPGNENGNTTQKNTLPYPVVVRYIRINPQRWNTSISMRLEFHGCQYAVDPVTFGDSYIILNLNPGHNQSNQQNNSHTIRTTNDFLKLRFRTDQPDGILFYAAGSQRDYFALELKRGYLYFHVDLGSFQNSPGKTTMIGGGLLDDYQWHDVIVDRERHNILLVVDRLETRMESNGDFFRLDLDKQVYLGGVPSNTFNADGVSVRLNFHGCMENVVFDDIKIIEEAREGLARYQTTGHITYACRLAQIAPLTFNKNDSYILARVPDESNVRVSMEFRTHNTNGVLFYNKLRHEFGDIKVKLNDDGHVWYKITVNSQIIVEDVVRNVDMGSLRDVFSDGLWHRFTLTIDIGKINCTVDRNSRITSHSMYATPGEDYWIGGFDTENSFLGCMRDIDVGNHPVNLTNIPSGNQRNIVLGACNIRDRCIPNPCENNGFCTQDWNSFTCHCNTIDYTGAVCHRSTHPLSCMHFKMYRYSLSKFRDQEQTVIDVDGSGPLKPFRVGCDIADAIESSETHISHDSMNEVKVDGCQKPGCYSRTIKYDAEVYALEAVIDRAYKCKQFIQYKCNNSRLLATPTEINPDLNVQWTSYGWWVGRSFQPMHYWGGASHGSHRCSCGLTEQGCEGDNLNSTRPVCNCDAQMPYIVADSGYLRDKEQLPVLELHFGDTGLVTDYKAGWHKLQELVCEGDNMFDNVVTFRKRDAIIKLPTFDAKASGDIWFQFKTTQRDGIILHNTGGNDFIQVGIYNGNTIQFSYDAGGGTFNLEYTASSGLNMLNNNEWHTVHIERNRKQAWLRVDTDTPVERNEEKEQGYRTLDLTSPLAVGATVDSRDGFVGCIRGMMVNGILMDLRGMVEREGVVYGVSPACVGKCDSSPCFHGGACKEEYDGYTCDCSQTPFRGRVCDREVGVNMLKNYMITYTFDKDQGLADADGEIIRIGFVTTFKQGILLQITDANNSEYISVEMNNNGGVKVVLDVGVGRDEVNTPSQGIDYTNGQLHEVTIRRQNRGRRLSVQVDDYQPGIGNWEYLPSSADTLLDNPKFLHIGRNSSLAPGLGFEGCLYRMQFDNFFPLKKAFQDPRPSYIAMEPEGMRENTCGFAQPPDPDTVVNVPSPTPCDNNTSQDNETIFIPCVGKCDSRPCFHGGACKEEYNGYTCDCSQTPFRGRVCDKEVGVNMLNNYMITYTFDKDRGLAVADGKFIRIGFVTKVKQGILLQITDATNTEYISVEMNNNGGVKVVLDVGFGRNEVNTPPQGIDYANGQPHEVIVRIENRGRRLSVQVDDYRPGVYSWELPSSADTILDNPKFLHIGRNSSLAPGLGFEGCLYRMQFDNFFPLKEAFQDPRPSYISMEPEGMRENTCGFAQPPGSDTVVNLPSPTPCDNNTSQDNETIFIRLWVGGNASRNSTYRYMHSAIMGDTSMQREAVIIGPSVVAGVLVLLLLVLVIFFILRRRKRPTGFEFKQSTMNHCDISMDPVAENT